LPKAGALEQLRAAGEVTPAAGSLSDLPLPLPVHDGKESPSAILARLRRNER